MGELTNSTEDSNKLKEEYNQVTKLQEKELQLNQKWYIIDSRWFNQWKKFVKCTDSSKSADENPGPINNKGLYLSDSNEELKDHLMEQMDYELLPEEAWDILIDHYGIFDNQHPIARKVIDEGKYISQKMVEIYPVRLKLCQYSNKDEVLSQKFSRSTKIDELDKEMRRLFQIPSEQETRIWNAYMENDYQELSKDQTIQAQSLQRDQLVVVETKDANGEWKLESKMQTSDTSTKSYFNGSSSIETNTNTSKGTSFTSTSSSYSSGPNYSLRNTSFTSDPYRKKKQTAGLCGLNNLGNTCFMNSALQCLSNVPTLTNYFKKNMFHKDLNVNNPLGMHGKIATTYANLIQTMWSGDHNSFAPREFKYAVGQFQPRFVGYQQQDSQELLAFLIDGLHEDLNRISKKPYIEIKDADGRPDEVVAQEAWENHRKRNDSVIVDTLHGLFRSNVDCPKCPRVSVTFDPFCYLTLPLPVKREKAMECTFVPLAINQSMVKYKVTVPKSGILKDLCKAVSVYNQIPYDNMIVTDVYNNRFHKVFQPTEQIRSIYDKDIIYVFETPPKATVFSVYMRYVSERGGCVLFGLPLLLATHDPDGSGTIPFVRLYKKILNGVQRFLINEKLKLEITNLLQMEEEEVLERMKERVDLSQESKEDTEYDVFNLFQIKSVNSFGTQEYKCYSYDDKPVKVSGGVHLCADWSWSLHENCFTIDYDGLVEKHESVLPSSNKKAASTVNLMNCMELFTSKEQLEKDNTWYCSNCKEHQQAYKKLDLWMLPPILIIHLKRFSNSRWSRDKLDTLIDFPVRDLDLSDFVVNPNKDTLPEKKKKYNLIAISNHYGGLGGGHYTAFAKNCVDKKWHYFDDSSVSDSSEERVVTKAAYLLVYQRQDLEEWLDSKQEQPFPFFEMFSPRATDTGPFQFQQNEDLINNNSSEDAMDTS